MLLVATREVGEARTRRGGMGGDRGRNGGGASELEVVVQLSDGER